MPELLVFLPIEGNTFSFDAMVCQKKIAHKISLNGGHYLMAVKGNILIFTHVWTNSSAAAPPSNTPESKAAPSQARSPKTKDMVVRKKESFWQPTPSVGWTSLSVKAG